MRRIELWIAIVIYLVGSAGCGGKTEDVSTHNDAAAVHQILTKHGCGNLGCHGNGGGIAVNSRYWVAIFSDGTETDAFRAWAVNVQAMVCADAGQPARMRVSLGDPNASYVMDALRGINLCGGDRMPVSGPYLDDSEMATVAAWIDAGAL